MNTHTPCAEHSYGRRSPDLQGFLDVIRGTGEHEFF